MNDILGEELEMRFQAAFAGSALLAWPQPPPNASGRGSGCSPTERPMPTTGSFSEKVRKMESPPHHDHSAGYTGYGHPP